ncbi:unnamed protein product [Mycena citricolor]|uniref:DUF302 domain-containing protein n=1 Tax=Mycena citricolor TaxID=2018698 RepID=A0AAD2HIP3_9AGAR|nr:unnamed protein product [Mycena citricolor]
MKKTVTTHTFQLVHVCTELPFEQVTASLQASLGEKRAAAGLIGATSLEDFQNRVETSKGPSDFMHFIEFNHGNWLQLFSDTPSPRAVVYVLGNPLIAHTMVKHDMRAALNVPYRLLVLQQGNGTDILYHLPSSLIALDSSEELKAAAGVLDEKLEQLVANITSV